MLETQLIAELKKQNPFVQKRVYDTFVKRMFRLCVRYVRVEEDAQELLMNGFLKFFRSVDKIEHRGENPIEPYNIIHKKRSFSLEKILNWFN